jgi:hypothetical protein
VRGWAKGAEDDVTVVTGVVVRSGMMMVMTRKMIMVTVVMMTMMVGVVAAAIVTAVVKMMVLLCGGDDDDSGFGVLPSQGKAYHLCQAAGRGDVPRVVALLEGPYPPQVDQREGTRTALMEAAANGRVEVVQLLLNKGADIEAQGSAALVFAVEKGHVGVVKLLLDKGANVHVTERDSRGATTPLIVVAARNGHVGVVAALLDKCVDINAVGGSHGRQNGPHGCCFPRLRGYGAAPPPQGGRHQCARDGDRQGHDG